MLDLDQLQRLAEGARCSHPMDKTETLYDGAGRRYGWVCRCGHRVIYTGELK